MLRRLAGVGREVGRGSLQLLYPATCLRCGQLLGAAPPGFCDGCRLALATDPHPACPRCAASIGPFALTAGGCSRCRSESFRFECVVRLGPYDGPLREVVLRLKHQAGEGLAEAVGALWAAQAEARLRELAADVVTPVPLHWWRRWRRGYNQSEELARALADRLHLPYRPRLLRRVRHTPMQTAQTPSRRRDNVRKAFRASLPRALAGKTVLLVDDVLTTGSTAGDAARALREAGAGRVVVAVLARSSV